MKNNITDRQQQIYNFIKSIIDRRGMPPTMREIGEKFAIRSTNGVEGHLAALEDRGLIKRERGKSRGILLRSSDRPVASVPLLGRVAAGQPILAPENREGEVALDTSIFSLKSANNVFALKVRGESMINAHIINGDIVVVRSQNHAENGDIVIALVDGEATVKRFFLEKSRIRLQPENDAMKPIMVERGDFKILGKVVGVIRTISPATASF